MIETILFFYVVIFIISALINIGRWMMKSKILGAIFMMVFLPILLIFEFFEKILKRFDKHFLVDIISFLVMTGFTVLITYYIHLMLYDSKTVHHVMVGIMAVLIIFGIVHKIIQLSKKYDRNKIYIRPEPKQES